MNPLLELFIGSILNHNIALVSSQYCDVFELFIHLRITIIFRRKNQFK
jgi:hypothetical protein